jgi:hypothetical protein
LSKSKSNIFLTHRKLKERAYILERTLALYFDSILCLLKGFDVIIKDNSLVKKLRATIKKECSAKEKALKEISELKYELDNIRESNKDLYLKAKVWLGLIV